MIEELELQNWCSHAESRLTFRTGTNLLMGDMGSGKSSVLDGISFALFGTFPALERRKRKLEHTIREGETQARVAVKLRWNGEQYRIERTVEQEKQRAAGNARMYRGDALVDEGPTAVTRYVEQLLGMDYDLFTRAIYSEQNNVEYFLDLDPRRRKQEFDALLGLDRFETVRGNVVSVLNTIRTQRKTMEERFDPKRWESLVARQKETERQLADTERGKTRRQKEMTEKTREKEIGEKEFHFLRQKKETYDRARQIYMRKEVRWEQLRREAQAINEKKLAELKKAYDAIEKERQEWASGKKEREGRWYALGEQRAQLAARVTEGEARQRQYSQQQAEWQEYSQGRSLDEWKREQEQVEKEWQEQQGRDSVLTNELAQIEKWQQELQRDIRQCPLCEQPLSAHALEHVRKEREEQREKKKKEQAMVRAKREELGKRCREYQQRLRRLEDLHPRLEEGKKATAERTRLAEKARALEAEWKKAQTEKETWEKQGEKIDQEHHEKSWALREAERQWTAYQEAKRLEKELAENTTELDGLKVDETELEIRRNALEQRRVAWERLRVEWDAMTQQERTLRETRTLVEEEIRTLERLQHDVQDAAVLEEELARYREAVMETQTLLRNSLIEAINRALNQIWKIFYPYGNYSELRIRVDEKDYVMEVFQGQWRPLETIASGGERSCAALSLRVALATVLTPTLSWLMLDEPTHNLDKRAVELLSQTLQFKVPEVVKQTFVITHEEALMGSDFASTYSLRRDKENAGATVVERI